MNDIKERFIEALLNTITYDEMTTEQMDLCVEYEKEKWTPIIDEYFKDEGLKETEKYIHNLWLDYEIADETEDALLKHINSKLEQYEFKPCVGGWDLFRNGRFMYFFEFIPAKEMNVQDVLDAVATGIDVMSNNLDLHIDMDSEEYDKIENCMFSAICNHYNIH